MKKLLRAISQFTVWQKIVTGGLLLLVLLTWLATCLVLAGVWPS
jgi:hypothetical protein